MTRRSLYVPRVYPALPDPLDRDWGLCPHCKQSAQSRVDGRLTCSRCQWHEPKLAPSPFTEPG